MKTNYDFSKAKRGAVIPLTHGKTRITIRMDKKIIDWFKSQVVSQGYGNYQTLINDALQSYIQNNKKPFETILRRVVREELQAVHA